MKKLDIINKYYSNLTVISEISKIKKERIYICVCSCGNKISAKQSSLLKGYTRSCGCKKGDLIRHGNSRTKLYMVYSGMKARCYNPKHISYKYYGAKGITVYPQWLDNFMTFKNWAILNGYKEGLWLDRKNRHKNYSPYNCHFITPSQQMQNKNKKNISNSSSKYIGVSLNPNKYKKWKAMIHVNKQRILLGTYYNEIDAAKARDNYIINNNLNSFQLNF